MRCLEDARAKEQDRNNREALRDSMAPSLSSRAKRPAAPLLAIDGDSFAHRSYHALSKSILRNDGRPAGAILGFANMLLKFYREQKPRAVIVGWDTLSAPTYRNKLFPAYQSGRRFDPELLEQLDPLARVRHSLRVQQRQAGGFRGRRLPC